MILAAILLITLWFRPRWELLWAYASGIAVLNLVLGYFRYAVLPEFEGAHPLLILLATAIDVAIVVASFVAIGALIVFFRSKKDCKKDAELDAEIARVRAQLAAREGAARPNDPPA